MKRTTEIDLPRSGPGGDTTLSPEVAVVGGGPAGLAAALTLARAGRAVAVFERTGYRGWRPGESLGPEVMDELAVLGVAGRLAEVPRLGRVTVRSAWGDGELVDRPAIMDPRGEGWHVDRARFDGMLLRAAQDAGVQVHTDARVEARPDGLTVRLGGGVRSLRPRLLVDATGRGAGLARRFGARWLAHDRMMGVVAVAGAPATAPVDDRAGVLIIEAVDDGWWYAAPLADGSLVLAYMTDGDLFRTTARDRRRHWQARLAATRWVRGLCAGRPPPRLLGARWASTGRLDRLFGEGWIAVGEAAVALDPLAGVGVGQALRSGREAAQAWLLGERGGARALEGYQERWTARFASFLAQRCAVYRGEGRWRDHLFWQRRHGPSPPGELSLSPVARIGLPGALAAKQAVAKIEALLPLADARLLYQLCRTEGLAHEVASAFRAQALGAADDSTAICALQELVRAGPDAGPG